MAVHQPMVIGAAQMEAMRQLRMRDFVESLRVHLGQRYPGFMRGLSASAQHRIVDNLLAHAASRGLSWQSSLATYADMMIGLAPNVHELDDVRAVLALPGESADAALVCLNPEALASAWRDGGWFADHLPLFLPPSAAALPPADKTAMAVTRALEGRLGNCDPMALARDGLEEAASLGLDGHADAGLVVAAWRLLYGPSHCDAQAFPWLVHVLHRQCLPQEVLALLRLRLRMDHDLLV